LAAHLLLPRPDRPHVVRLLRLGRLEGVALPAHARRARRPRELRRDPPGRDLRRADTHHGLAVGEGVVGGVVDLERGPARAVPRAGPVLLRVLHASLLGRAGRAAREHERRLRAVRRRPHPGLVPRDPALEEVHPSGRLHVARAADEPLAVLRLLCLVGGDAPALRDPLQRRARREAHRRAPARAAGAAVVSGPPSEWQYVAGAYLVVFVTVLAWVAIIAAKLQRLQRQLAELVEQARDRG